jgi:sialate O-acetylesterase
MTLDATRDIRDTKDIPGIQDTMGTTGTRGFRTLVALLAMALLGSVPARADVTLPALLSDNMVLQRDVRINIWGKADPQESITVQLGPDSSQTTAGDDGRWDVKLDPLPSGGPYDLTVSGKNSITVHNVAIGEVWVCSGESNMEYKVEAAKDAAKEMADADLPMLRLFVVKHAAAESVQGDCDGAWVVCGPDTVKDFPAIPFFFARELNRGLRMPFGLIESAWGPSRAASWTPRATLEKDPVLHKVLDQFAKAVDQYPTALTDYQTKLAAWQTDANAAKSVGGTPPPRPVRPLDPAGAREPASLFDAMIAPLTRYPIRGVLWSQGESDTANPELYAKLFPAMIASWRATWEEGTFPFYYTQLSGFLGPHAAPEPSIWAELREVQAKSLAIPKTGMAVTIDTEEPHELHPADKQDPGHRLALLAEKQIYEKPDVTAAGPEFAGMEIADGKAVVTFENTGGGLVSKSGGAAVKGFQIAGADGRFVWADAAIHGDAVTVQSKDVPAPAAVRYAWADFPDCDLKGKTGLPAVPFRTDAPVTEQVDAGAAAVHKKKHHAVAE